ncbi:MAG: FHA domain-containing protein [Planctomycetota bacterium]|nr:MAG: FHA domain-containing protein [Planctomycetota bacterium]
MEFGESFVQFFESTYLPKGSGGSRGSGSSRLEDEEELSPLGDELLNHPHFKTPGIYLTHGGILGEYIHIQGRILLGRSSQCTLVFRDVDVSRTHASLEVEEDGVLIRDLASRNGVFVNEQRCDELKLQGFDLVRLGNTEFIFIETEENLEMLRRLVRRGSVLLRKISTLSGEVGGAAMEVEAQGEEKQKSIAEVFKKDKEEVIQEGEKENE